jgi:hypothetical protein
MMHKSLLLPFGRNTPKRVMSALVLWLEQILSKRDVSMTENPLGQRVSPFWVESRGKDYLIQFVWSFDTLVRTFDLVDERAKMNHDGS